MILFIALVINLRLKPFKTRGLNTIEEVTLIASWCTLFGGALLFSPKIELDWFKVLVTIIIFSANLGVFFFLLYRLQKHVMVDDLIDSAWTGLNSIEQAFESARRKMPQDWESFSGRFELNGATDANTKADNDITATGEDEDDSSALAFFNPVSELQG